MPEGRLYRSLGGDDAPQVMWEKELVLKVHADPEVGELLIEHIEDPREIDPRDSKMSFGSIHVRVVRFPLGFAVGGKGEAKIEPIDEYTKDRFDIRESRRGVSFVRASREIENKRCVST